MLYHYIIESLRVMVMGFKSILAGLAGFAVLGACPAGLHAAPALVPFPADITPRAGAFTLKTGVALCAPDGDIEARGVAVQLRAMLKRAHPAGGPALRIADHRHPCPAEGAIVFERTKPEASPEAYDVTVDDRRVTITAATRQGLFYGAVTMWQLALQTHPDVLPGMHIHDAPRYGWRGLMIDSVRHFQSVGDLKRLIDAMAMLKLNRLHWHLTDDQGWRLEIKAYPRLTAIGAWRSPKGADAPGHGRYGGDYTQAQVRDLVAYAQARNITIVPEIELPGHATAALTAYPEYGMTGQAPASGMSDWGVYSNLYTPDDKTFAFLDTVLDEVMDLFPSPYIHIGGDEAIKNQWQESPAVQARLKALGLKDEDALQSWFVARIGRHLAARGRHMIGWDEILDGGVAPDAVVMSWRGLAGARDAARQGHDTILSPQPDLYLDSRQSLSGREPPGRSELATLRTVYDFNSEPTDIPSDERHHVLGVQANAWTEHMRTFDRFQAMAFPRLLALAEVGWDAPQARDWTRFSTNLPMALRQLERQGMTYDPVPFEPDMVLSRNNGTLTAALSSPLGIGDIHYTLDGSIPSVRSPIYAGPLPLAAPARIRARTFVGDQPLGDAQSFDASPARLDTRTSSQLMPCGGSVPLRLEAAGAAAGKRPVFMISIYKPCWVWPAVDLSQGRLIKARIGKAPFNFQLAGGRRIVAFDRPTTSPYGELVVRLRSGADALCQGETLAVIPISKAVDGKPGLADAAGRIPARTGVHDLCLTFNRPSVSPLWAINEISLTPDSQ